jgi:hypothetical protein
VRAANTAFIVEFTGEIRSLQEKDKSNRRLDFSDCYGFTQERLGKNGGAP